MKIDNFRSAPGAASLEAIWPTVAESIDRVRGRDRPMQPLPPIIPKHHPGNGLTVAHRLAVLHVGHAMMVYCTDPQGWIKRAQSINGGEFKPTKQSPNTWVVERVG